MKRTITTFALFVALLASQSGKAQAPAIEWSRSFGGEKNDILLNGQQTSDGGYVFIGYSASKTGDVTGNHMNDDYWVVKLNASGNLQWQKSLGGSWLDWGYSVKETADGGYVVAGSSASGDGDVTDNHGDIDSWILKLDAIGNIIWQKSIGGAGSDNAHEILPTIEGGYVMAGSSASNDGDFTGNHGNTDYWLAKLSTTGSVEWQKVVGGSAGDNLRAMQRTADGGFILAGSSISNDGDVSGNHGNYDYWIVKMNNAGTIEWQKSLGGSAEDRAEEIVQTADGGYIVAGSTFSNDGDVSGNHGGQDYWIVKLSGTGNIVWQKTFGGTQTDLLNSIALTKDNGCIVAGWTNSNDGNILENHGDQDYWILKLGSNGDIEWQKSLGGTQVDQARWIAQTRDNGYIAAGMSSSNDGQVSSNQGYLDYWIVKLAGDGTAIEEQIKSISFTIQPNPANGSITVSNLPINSMLKIIDLTGKIVYSTSTTETQKQISIDNLANGVYLIQVKSKDIITSRKFVISR